MTLIIDISGQKYGDLTVLRQGESKNNRTHFDCVCDCGTECLVRADHLRRGHTVSCGCKNQRKAKRGHDGFREKGHPLRQLWTGMKARCENPTHISYRLYGAKGIRVCDRWHTFENFVADMGPRPKGTSLDRVDSNDDYCPENCKWATATDQNRNKSSNRLVTIYGRSWPVSVWSEISLVPAKTIYARLKHGWPEKIAVFAPPGWRRPA